MTRPKIYSSKFLDELMHGKYYITIIMQGGRCYVTYIGESFHQRVKNKLLKAY